MIRDVVHIGRPETVAKPNLGDAADGFESLLWNEVLKSMRKSVGAESQFASDMIHSMFDEALSQILAEQASGLEESLRSQFGPVDALAFLESEGWVSPTGDPIHAPHAGQHFGADRPGRPGGHFGFDIARREGHPVVSVREGIVKHIQRDSNASGGLWVEVEHGHGVSSRYLHLNHIDARLRVGDPVQTGQTLGGIGNTGPNSRGAHLHFELRAATGGESTPIDPYPHLKKWGAGSFSSQVSQSSADAPIQSGSRRHDCHED